MLTRHTAYREFRIEDSLEDEKGKKLKLKRMRN